MRLVGILRVNGFLKWRLELLDLLCILSEAIWAILSCTFWGSACRDKRFVAEHDRPA